MKSIFSLFLFGIIGFLGSSISVWANSAPEISEITASQRNDNSGIVDISYTLTDADNDPCTLSVLVSNDNGSSWTTTPSPSTLSGDLIHISPGKRHIAWNSKVDLPQGFGSNHRVKVTADDGQHPADPNDMVWISINDPGVAGQKGFNGQMSKHEITNAQYCQFLNAVKAAGQIVVHTDGYVYAVSDTSFSQRYFYTFPTDSNSQITFSEGIFGVRIRDGYSMANHPVTYVSWYGAMAFCTYYGYRLPTEWEWQAVADYDGSYVYGCGPTISQSKANYKGANPHKLSSYPYTSTVVFYSSYGYEMADMAGNVWEWTSSIKSDSQRVICGGSWLGDDMNCMVSNRFAHNPLSTTSITGFRVCR